MQIVIEYKFKFLFKNSICYLFTYIEVTFIKILL